MSGLIRAFAKLKASGAAFRLTCANGVAPLANRERKA